MLGRIFHITHTNSYRFKRRAQGRMYVWDESLPYVNPEDWGLADYTWERINDRYYHVKLPTPGAPRSVPENLSPETRARAEAVRAMLLDIRKSLHPEQPQSDVRPVPNVLSISAAATAPGWGSDLERIGDVLRVETPPAQWAPGVAFPFLLRSPLDEAYWHWVRALLDVEDGAISISVVDDGMNLLHERYVSRGAPEELFIPVPPLGRHVLIRNIDDTQSRSVVNVREIQLVAQPKAAPVSV
jgi:hypothetical protein